MFNFKKTMITFFSVALVLASNWSFITASYAASSVTSSSPLHLKINDYYVLYTSPKAPYIDTKQRIMVPLRAVSELLGAQVEYHALDKTATIKMDGHQLSVKSGSKVVTQDSNNFTMDTVPVVYNNSMIIPLRVLLDGFEIKGNINKEYGYVNIQDERLLKTPLVASFEEFDSTMNHHIENENAFVPLTTKVTMKTTRSSALSSFSVTVSAKNITGKDVPAGREDLHPVFLSNGSYVLDSDRKTTDGAVRSRPAVKANETITRTWNFSLQSTESLLYVLAKGRTFDMGVQ